MTNQERCDELLNQIQSRNADDYSHAMRVQKIAMILANADTRLDDSARQLIQISAALHDVGTLSISEQILYKNGRLDFEQYEEMQTHPGLAETYVADFESGAEIAKLIRHHHENFNGFGYPDGIKGESIPLGSRIIHVAEAFDSMVRRRTDPRGVENHPNAALSELQKYAGRMYDATVVANAAAHLDEILSIYGGASA